MKRIRLELEQRTENLLVVAHHPHRRMRRRVPQLRGSKRPELAAHHVLSHNRPEPRQRHRLMNLGRTKPDLLRRIRPQLPLHTSPIRRRPARRIEPELLKALLVDANAHTRGTPTRVERAALAARLDTIPHRRRTGANIVRPIARKLRRDRPRLHPNRTHMHTTPQHLKHPRHINIKSNVSTRHRMPRIHPTHEPRDPRRHGASPNNVYLVRTLVHRDRATRLRATLPTGDITPATRGHHPIVTTKHREHREHHTLHILRPKIVDRGLVPVPLQIIGFPQCRFIGPRVTDPGAKARFAGRCRLPLRGSCRRIAGHESRSLRRRVTSADQWAREWASQSGKLRKNSPHMKHRTGSTTTGGRRGRNDHSPPSESSRLMPRRTRSSRPPDDRRSRNHAATATRQIGPTPGRSTQPASYTAHTHAPGSQPRQPLTRRPPLDHGPLIKQIRTIAARQLHRRVKPTLTSRQTHRLASQSQPPSNLSRRQQQSVIGDKSLHAGTIAHNPRYSETSRALHAYSRIHRAKEGT